MNELIHSIIPTLRKLSADQLLTRVRNYRAAYAALNGRDVTASERTRIMAEIHAAEEAYFLLLGVYPRAAEVIGTMDYIAIKLRFNKWVFRKVYWVGITNQYVHIEYLGRHMRIWQQGYSIEHRMPYVQYHAVNPSDLDFLLNEEV